MRKLPFASDYMAGAHPALLNALVDTNRETTIGYGEDAYCERARGLIREACGMAPDQGQVYFLLGGTQTNALAIDALLRSYQGVVSVDTAHIATHESGAIEHSGHKVLPLPQVSGKLCADTLRAYLKAWHADGNRDHMVMPGMVYLSQPTEYGTLYSKKELCEISGICREYEMPLYVDGARMAYALASKACDVTLKDLAELTDLFYIGGTKCGALFGEALVVPKKTIPGLFSMIKQHGALLAKGRLLGVQFGELFQKRSKDRAGEETYLYTEIGETALKYADRIREGLKKAEIPVLFETSTNQIFPVVSCELLKKWEDRIEYSFWEKADDDHVVIRLATSWSTEEEDVEKLIGLIASSV